VDRRRKAAPPPRGAGRRAGPAAADARLAQPALAGRGRPPRRVREGRLRLRPAAVRLGCFSCHGLQGRFDTPNPGSLKGYVPSWSGEDFPELARDDGEIREWIRDGGPKRLRENPVAAFFLRRQAIRMPAYGARVSEDEVRQITAYIRWLRSGAAPVP
jgi:mono/diheme cytochrome c family protein